MILHQKPQKKGILVIFLQTTLQKKKKGNLNKNYDRGASGASRVIGFKADRPFAVVKSTANKSIPALGPLRIG